MHAVALSHGFPACYMQYRHLAGFPHAPSSVINNETYRASNNVTTCLRLTTVAVYTDVARNSWNFRWIACSMSTQSSQISYSKSSFSGLPHYLPLS